MMQKEEKIVMVLLVMAVLSLIVGYFGFSKGDSAYSAYSVDSKVGDKVYVEGAILKKQMTGKGDNLILKLSDTDVQVFIPKNNGAKELYAALKTDMNVRINGKVSEFNQKKEIVVENINDVIRI